MSALGVEMTIAREQAEDAAERNAWRINRLLRLLEHERTDPAIDAGWPRLHPTEGTVNR